MEQQGRQRNRACGGVHPITQDKLERARLGETREENLGEVAWSSRPGAAREKRESGPAREIVERPISDYVNRNCAIAKEKSARPED